MALVVAAMSCSFYVACGDDDVIIGTGGSAGAAGRAGSGGSAGTTAGAGGTAGASGTGTGGASGSGSVDEPDAGGEDAGFFFDAGDAGETTSDPT